MYRELSGVSYRHFDALADKELINLSIKKANSDFLVLLE